MPHSPHNSIKCRACMRNQFRSEYAWFVQIRMHSRLISFLWSNHVFQSLACLLYLFTYLLVFTVSMFVHGAYYTYIG